MGSRLVLMLLVSGLLRFQGVLPLSARPVFDVTGFPSDSSGRNSEIDDGHQHNLKSTEACEDGTERTFASQSTSARSFQARRVLRSSSVPGPDPPPGTDPPIGSSG